MNNIPKFFQTLCGRKQIYNASTEDLLFYFPPTESGHRIIKLEDYDCICVGYKNGVKECVRFRILKCMDIPLLGSHEILMDGVTIKVDSLTNFKKEILGYEDFVSFDKSTFLLLEDKEKVFRLHTIRERIQLPLFQGGYSFQEDERVCKKNTIHIKVNESNEEEVINNLLNAFLNVFDQMDGYKIDKFSRIVESVFSRLIEFVFKETVDNVYTFMTDDEDKQFLN